MTPHGIAPHGAGKALISNGNLPMRRQVENLPPREGSASFGKVDLVSAGGLQRGGGGQWERCNQAVRAGLSPKWARHPIQGHARAHRSHFLQVPQAGAGKARRVRECAILVGSGLGYGGRP